MKNVKPFKNDFEFQALRADVERLHPKYNILLLLGVFTGLRVSDLLLLQVKQLLSQEFYVIEKKTKKKRCFLVPFNLWQEITRYIDAQSLSKNDFLIFSTNNTKSKPLSRVQAYRVLKKASVKNEMANIGTHSMRKTFAKKHYEKYKDLKALQKELNHQFITTTLMYLFDVSALNEVPSFVNKEEQLLPPDKNNNIFTISVNFGAIKEAFRKAFKFFFKT